MFTYYIYGLQYKCEVIYIGVSQNPGHRFICHTRDNNSDVYELLSKLEDKTEVSIIIIATFRSKSKVLNKEVREVEKYWWCVYVTRGHPLRNKVLTLSSSIPLKYHKHNYENKISCKKEGSEV